MTRRACLVSAADYPYVGTVALRWDDVDRTRHLGLAAYTSMTQDFVAKVAFDILQVDCRGDWPGPAAVHLACDILRPFAYPGELVAGVGIHRIGECSLAYEVVFAPPTDLRLYTCVARMVQVFGGSSGPIAAPLPRAVRDMAEGLLIHHV